MGFFLPGQSGFCPHKASTRLSDHAADTKELSGIFQSKLYYFSTQSVFPLFGKKPLDQLSDIALTRTARDTFRVRVLGVKPINGNHSELTPYGFYVHEMTDLKLPADLKSGPIDLGQREVLSWSHGGVPFSAKLSLTAEGTSELGHYNAESFPYDKLWGEGADKKMVGLVIAGSNRSGDAHQILAQYRAFYEGRGYQCTDSGPIKDTKRLLEQKLKGEVDYFTKEAHSDGDERNLFRIGKESMLVTCQNKTGGKAYLLCPKKGESDLLSNSEFGALIRARQTPLVYFNASCWSHTKAVNELTAAGRNLWVIPSATSVYPLQNLETSASRQMLAGFLGGKSFAEIKSLMEKDEKYKKHTSNVFLFPGDYGYSRKLLDLVQAPITSKISLTKEGRPYFPDQLH